MNDANEREPVDPRAYSRIFEGNPDGVAILEELSRVFAGDPWVGGGVDGARATDRNLGSLRVLNFIVNKINLAAGLEPWGEQEEAKP
mgnify:FL=1